MVTDSLPGEQSECFSALPCPFPGFAIPLAQPITPREIVNGDGQHHREDVCSKEDNVIRRKLPFYYRRHVDPSKGKSQLHTTSFDSGQALRAFCENSLVGHASRKISRYPAGGFVQRLGLRPVLLGIPCYWNMF